MDFTLDFLKVFSIAFVEGTPIFLVLMLPILILGILVGKIEKWSLFNSIYWSIITATTVGYGDFRPKHYISKSISLLIPLFGIIFTGFIVSLSIRSATIAFDHSGDSKRIQKQIDKVLED